MKAFVIMRDRVTYAQRCVDALQAVGLDVVIVDHGSTWTPAKDWLHFMAGKRHAEVWFAENRHPRDLWNDYQPGLSPIRNYVGEDERFVVTDCDVVPDDDCPTDWMQIMNAYLNYLPAVRKVGLGLRTDDLPVHYAHRDKVVAWEKQHQFPHAAHVIYNPGAAGVFASVDTTLAMYRRYETPFTLRPAVRLRPPYVARHLPWYEDTANLTEEQAYYLAHAEYGHWRQPDGYIDEHAFGG